MKRQLANLLFLFLIVCCPLSSLAAEVLFYDTDNVGTPVAMWNTSGNKVWEGEYYPFGEEFRVTKAPADNKKHFVGKEKDEETGLTYFGARYMDETTGRFTSPDPVRAVDPFTSKTNTEILTNPQRLNRYVYCLNNPYRYVDPDGRNPVARDKDHDGIDDDVDRSDNDVAISPGPSGPGNTPSTPIWAGRSFALKGGGEASSLANASRLRGQLAGQEIAGGHAFEKHVLNQGEFKGLGIRTREQFSKHIENVVNNPTASRQLSGGRSAYWQESSGTVVIRNPRAADGGTAFQPTNGRAYFDGLR